MRSSMNLICSCFKISLIMIAIFNDSKFVCNVLNAKSIWLIVIKKHYIFCFRFLTSINKQKKLFQSSQFSSNRLNSVSKVMWAAIVVSWFFISYCVVSSSLFFLIDVVFVIVVVSISELFYSMTNDSSSWSISKWIEHSKHFESNVFDSFSIVKNKSWFLRRDKIIYRDFIVIICSTLSFCDNIASRRQLNTSYRRFDLRVFKRRI